MSEPEHLCKNCRWWEGHPLNSIGFSACRLLGSDDGNPRNSNTLAFALDVDEYHAALLTKPDFGCIHWEGEGQTNAQT